MHALSGVQHRSTCTTQAGILGLQKHAARIILNIERPQDVPSSDLFFKVNGVTFNQRIYVTLRPY